MNDTPLDNEAFTKHMPALTEPGALETIGATAWLGYQYAGKGVVVYTPPYGDLEFMSAHEYAAAIRDMVISEPTPGEPSSVVELQNYDPFSEVLFATVLAQPGETKGKLVLFKLKPPKSPRRCRATWRPTPRTRTA